MFETLGKLVEPIIEALLKVSDPTDRCKKNSFIDFEVDRSPAYETDFKLQS